MISAIVRQRQYHLRVLSLFDGMSCGMLALIDAGINVERYVAYEIDKYAIQTSEHNFPLIEHMGDVFCADFTQYVDFDFLIGGSPCTHWSLTKKGREVTAEGAGWELFTQFIRALKESKPKFFIYENNKSMSSDIRESISREFGFDPYCINSDTVSAQYRQRLYWVGRQDQDGTYSKVPVQLPERCPTEVSDILQQCGCDAYPLNTVCGKSYAIKKNYYKSSITNFINGPLHYPQTGAAVFVGDNISQSSITVGGKTHRVYHVRDGTITVDGELIPVHLRNGCYIIRKLTVAECKLLQNIPDWYEFPVSDTRAIMMLGNGWTVGVISILMKATQSGNT